MLVSPQWAPVADKGQQWISGSAVGRPPVGGYGNLFLPLGAGADRYNGGALLYVQSQGVRHGDPNVLARLAAGEPSISAR